jgi:uncharacterized protein
MIQNLLDMLKGELIIDAHAHYGHYYNFYSPFDNWEACEESAQKFHFQAVYASSTLAIANQVAEGNAALLKEFDRSDNKTLKPYMVFKPNFPDYLDELIRICDTRGIYTFKLHDDKNDLAYDAPEYMPFYDWVSQRGAIILYHTFGKMHLEPIMRVAKTYPKIRCLLAHSGITDESLYIEAVKKHENIYLELANSWAWYGLIERLTAAVGAENILFGSDMPFLSPEQQLGRIVMARISDADKMSILGHNAVRLFGLNPGISA